MSSPTGPDQPRGDDPGEDRTQYLPQHDWRTSEDAGAGDQPANAGWGGSPMDETTRFDAMPAEHPMPPSYAPGGPADEVPAGRWQQWQDPAQQRAPEDYAEDEQRTTRSTGLIIAVVLLAILVIALAIALFTGGSDDADQPGQGAGTQVEQTQEPTQEQQPQEQQGPQQTPDPTPAPAQTPTEPAEQSEEIPQEPQDANQEPGGDGILDNLPESIPTELPEGVELPNTEELTEQGAQTLDEIGQRITEFFGGLFSNSGSGQN